MINFAGRFFIVDLVRRIIDSGIIKETQKRNKTMNIDNLQNLILSTSKSNNEKLFDWASRVKPIRRQSIQIFIKLGGTVKRTGNEIHASLDGYLGREPYRNDLENDYSVFLCILRWAQTRLNDKLYHQQ